MKKQKQRLEMDLWFDLQLIALSLLLIEIFFRQKNKRLERLKIVGRKKIRKKFRVINIFADSSVSNRLKVRFGKS
jgi:hypothetical protein